MQTNVDFDYYAGVLYADEAWWRNEVKEGLPRPLPSH